ncbi:caspase family protein [Actinospica durhamensis]|uniref:Caspase family protein n=1 Tax=Actinospica durhamensis TaxID=1508375 RepID=A0A941IWD4_9ACTN|nr:caspase family protein [Actinospica durhamensis]MBR7839141.1 caspase family protein [Actinospica durhamensis]
MSVQPVDPARSRIVLVGASVYEDPTLPDVPEITRNLADLTEVLTDAGLGAFPAEHCLVVPEDATVPQVGDVLHDAADKAEDLLLFYFAGHGLIGEDGELLLALRGTRERNPDFNALPFETVRKTFLNIRTKARNRVVVIDSCFSGRATGKALAGEAKALLNGLTISGSYTLASAPPNKQALVRPGEQHTAFTGRLLDLLRTGSEEPDEYLSFGLIYRHLLARMTAEGLPHPQARSMALTDQLGLVRNLAWHIEPAPIPEEIRELLASRSARGKRAGVDELRDWVQDADPRKVRAARQQLAQIVEHEIPQIAEAARQLLAELPEQAERAPRAEARQEAPAPPEPAGSTPLEFRSPSRARAAALLNAAEDIAYSIEYPVEKAETLANIAEVLTALDPNRAKVLVNGVEAQLNVIDSLPGRALVLASLARAVYPVSVVRAERLVDRALYTVDGLTPADVQWHQLSYLAQASAALIGIDSDREADMYALAEQLARGVGDRDKYGMVLAAMSEAFAHTHGARALSLAEQAEGILDKAEDAAVKANIRTKIVSAYARTDHRRAVRIADGCRSWAGLISWGVSGFSRQTCGVWP